MHRYTVEFREMKFSCDVYEDALKALADMRAGMGAATAALRQSTVVNRLQDTQATHRNRHETVAKIGGSSGKFLLLLLQNKREVSETELVNFLEYSSKNQLAGVRTALINALQRVGLKFDTVIAHRKDDQNGIVYSIKPEYIEKIQELIKD